ncbi:S-adenosyl-L-methionine-dependent methyltransferase [Phialemonium atrogriseum]|uniref:S-adenosyl-L-methionine-dependent methyltransferase n=1 Tax=Phialemonium atrogriseum TaxID=1093897 RepID=A0AAJ0BRJ8_9PEZI|nr:S-adenosyl-L-methionine-dependent methyltransferase [Phialemonium atrogriseum]KAK1762737.1 S-adenosyl-L-methionine-dependent methyltransferase [Phialemonium atrogriseum]
MPDKIATEQDTSRRGHSVSVGILPAHHWATQDPPPLEEIDEDDSALGSDTASSTASLTSSILHYRTLHGRRYHSERGNAQYWASNDEQQNEALDILHHVLTLCTNGKLHQAPIKKGIQKAIDIGTGTGIWALDFADQFPDTEVIGTDISAIQPSWVPPNLKFEIEDCTGEWTFAPNSVDYVHIRWLLGSIADWTELFKQAYRCLKPGGYVESFEPDSVMQSDDGTVKETSAMGQWGKFFEEGGKKLGRPFSVLSDRLQRKGMEGAGFVDIEELDFKTPLGSWPHGPREKEIGRYSRLVADQDTEGFVLFAANTIGWTKDEIMVYVSHLRREIRSPKHHGYYQQRIVWARKPE